MSWRELSSDSSSVQSSAIDSASPVAGVGFSTMNIIPFDPPSTVDQRPAAMSAFVDKQELGVPQHCQRCETKQRQLDKAWQEIEGLERLNARLSEELRLRNREYVLLQEGSEHSGDSAVRIRSLESEVQDLEAQVKYGAELLRQQTVSLQQASSVVDELRRELQAREEGEREIQHEVKRLRSQVSRMKAERAEMTSVVGELTSAVTAMTPRRSEETQQKQAREMTQTQSEEVRQLFGGESAAGEAKLSSPDGSADALAAGEGHHNGQLPTMAEEKADAILQLETRLSETKDEVARLKQALAAAEREAAVVCKTQTPDGEYQGASQLQLELQLAAAKNANESLAADKLAAIDQLQRRDLQIAQLKDELALAQSSNCDIAAAATAAAAGEKAHLEDKVRELQELAARHEVCRVDLVTKHEAVEALLEASRGEIQQLKETSAELKTAQTDAQLQLQDAREARNAAMAREQEIREEVAAAGQREKAALEQVQDTRAALAAAEADRDARIDALQAHLHAAEEHMQQVKGEMAAAEQRTMDVVERLVAEKKKVGEVQVSLSAAVAHVAKLEASLETERQHHRTETSSSSSSSPSSSSSTSVEDDGKAKEIAQLKETVRKLEDTLAGTEAAYHADVRTSRQRETEWERQKQEWVRDREEWDRERDVFQYSVDDLEARLEKAAENFEVERKGWRDRDDEKEQERVRETARLTRESSDAQRMQEELQALVADLRQETADLQQRLQETADLQQRLQDARTDRDEALARVGAVKGELAHSEEMHRARTESLNEELASTKTEAHLLRQERDEAVSRDQAIRSEMAAIKEELALVRTTMAATQQAEEERRRMLRETETELESNKELLKVSEMRVATLEAAKVRVSRHEQLVAEEEMRLRDEIARLKSVDVQRLALQEEVNTLTGLEQAAQQRADKASNELESTQRRLEVVEEEMSSLTVEHKQQTEDLELMTVLLKTAESKREETQTVMATETEMLRNQVQAAEQRASAAEATVIGLRAELSCGTTSSTADMLEEKQGGRDEERNRDTDMMMRLEKAELEVMSLRMQLSEAHEQTRRLRADVSQPSHESATGETRLLNEDITLQVTGDGIERVLADLRTALEVQRAQEGWRQRARERERAIEAKREKLREAERKNDREREHRRVHAREEARKRDMERDKERDVALRREREQNRTRVRELEQALAVRGIGAVEGGFLLPKCPEGTPFLLPNGDLSAGNTTDVISRVAEFTSGLERALDSLDVLCQAMCSKRVQLLAVSVAAAEAEAAAEAAKSAATVPAEWYKIFRDWFQDSQRESGVEEKGSGAAEDTPSRSQSRKFGIQSLVLSSPRALGKDLLFSPREDGSVGTTVKRDGVDGGALLGQIEKDLSAGGGLLASAAASLVSAASGSGGRVGRGEVRSMSPPAGRPRTPPRRQVGAVRVLPSPRPTVFSLTPRRAQALDVPPDLFFADDDVSQEALPDLHTPRIPLDGLEAGLSAREAEAREEEWQRLWTTLKARHRQELRKMRNQFSQLLVLKQECEAKASYYKVRVKKVEAMQVQQQLRVLEQQEALSSESRLVQHLRAEVETLESRRRQAEMSLETEQQRASSLNVELSLMKEKESVSLADLKREVAEEASGFAGTEHERGHEEDMLDLRGQVDALSVQIVKLRSEASYLFEQSESDMREFRRVYDAAHAAQLQQARFDEELARGEVLRLQQEGSEREQAEALERASSRVAMQELQKKLEDNQHCVFQLQQHSDDLHQAFIDQECAMREKSRRLNEAETELVKEHEKAKDGKKFIATMIRLVLECHGDVQALIHNARRTREYCEAQESQMQQKAIGEAAAAAEEVAGLQTELIRMKEVAAVVTRLQLDTEHNFHIKEAEDRIRGMEETFANRLRQKEIDLVNEFEAKMEEKEEEVTKLEEQLVLLLVKKN